jgi:phospholipid/cholesterol/gamma-HCH transport system permease protein
MRMIEIIGELQDFYTLSVRGLLGVLNRPFYLKDTIEQMDYVGSGSLFIVLLSSMFIGMALSLQLAAELSAMGLKMYIGKIVGVAVIREIGPVLTALVYAGRVGSGMASELGSMILGHQVDTIRVFGVDPMKKLVTPRILSSVIMLPLLTVIGDLVSILGGYFVAVFVSRQSATFYWSSIRDAIYLENVLSGIIKPFVFGYLIACIGCYMGLSTRGGATGLRVATTKAVVASIIAVIMSDFILTRILLYIFGFTL